MRKRSKRYAQAKAQVEHGKRYPLPEAIQLLQSFPAPKFDEAVSDITSMLSNTLRSPSRRSRPQTTLSGPTSLRVEVVPPSLRCAPPPLRSAARPPDSGPIRWGSPGG